MAPPITYEVDGKQYVAFIGGMGRQATAVGPNEAKIDYPPWGSFVFEVDGKGEMPKAAPAASSGTGRRAWRTGRGVGAGAGAGAGEPAGPAPEQKN